MAHCAAILEGRNWREDRNWPDRFHRVMDINVRVPLTLATAAIDHMAEHGGGSIVLVGSVAGRTGGTSVNTPPDYSASKGAVHALVKWLSRQAIGRGVLVNGVAPGPVQTPMTTGFTAGAQLPLGRLGTPGRAGMADRVPLHAGGELFLGRHPGCERRRLRRLSGAASTGGSAFPRG